MEKDSQGIRLLGIRSGKVRRYGWEWPWTWRSSRKNRQGVIPQPLSFNRCSFGNLILNLGSEEQKDEFLPKIVNGKMILSLAITEPESSWDDKAYDPEGINGEGTPEKMIILSTAPSYSCMMRILPINILCVTRRRHKGTPENGTLLFLVDAKSPGVSYTVLDTLNNKNQQCEVIFKNVESQRKYGGKKSTRAGHRCLKPSQLGAVMLCAANGGAGRGFWK